MSRGGARYGAGRPGYKLKVESLRSIDVRRWAREGLLREGAWGAWAWTDAETGETLASIGYRCGYGALTLDYHWGGSPVSEWIPLERTDCNFGGFRRWFACPECRRRVAKLHLRGGRFRCRTCQRLAYASQSEDEIARTWRAQAKLERRLADDWERPKGMHHSTYAGLLERLSRLEEKGAAGLADLMVRALG